MTREQDTDRRDGESRFPARKLRRAAPRFRSRTSIRPSAKTSCQNGAWRLTEAPTIFSSISRRVCSRTGGEMLEARALVHDRREYQQATSRTSAADAQANPTSIMNRRTRQGRGHDGEAEDGASPCAEPSSRLIAVAEGQRVVEQQREHPPARPRRRSAPRHSGRSARRSRRR